MIRAEKASGTRRDGCGGLQILLDFLRAGDTLVVTRIDWVEIRRKVRFERAGGVCQGCGRPHGLRVRCLPDGRWFDTACQTWRNGRGRPARWPDLVETAVIRQTRVVLPRSISIITRATIGCET